MKNIQKRIIVAAPRLHNGVPDFDDFQMLHTRLCEQGTVLSAEICIDSKPFSDFEHMYPGYTLLLHVEDIAKIPSFDASVLDDWIFSHESSVIIYTNALRTLPKRWQSILTLDIESAFLEKEWKKTTTDFREHIRIWYKTGLKRQDEQDAKLAELVDRST